MRGLILIIALTFFSIANINAASLCDISFFSGHDKNTEKFINFLGHINEEKVLPEDVFQEFIDRVNSGNLINPFELVAFSKEVELYGKVFQDYVDSELLDLERVRSFLRRVQQKEGKERVERKVIEEEFESPYLPIEFGVIEPDGGALHYPLEVMTTPITQSHWSEVFERELLELNQELILSDLPKVNINAFSQMVFADKLSKQKNLIPTFNLDESQKSHGEASLGSWFNFDDQKFFFKGDYLESEGYRFPTINERDYIRKKAFKSVGGEKAYRERLNDFAVFSEQNYESAQDVILRKGIDIDGSKYFDLLGNVDEAHIYNIEKLGEENFIELMFYTGSFKSSFSSSFWGVETSFTDKRNYFGGRLVRTLKK